MNLRRPADPTTADSPFTRRPGNKGTDFAIMIERLCTGLRGSPMARDTSVSNDSSTPLQVSHPFLAIQPGAFGAGTELDSRRRLLVALVKASDLRNGFEEVLVAEVRHRRDGISVDGSLWPRLSELVAQANQSPPKPDATC